MSDPVSSTEIEDVLSSIRRLVADDAKKSPRKDEVPDRLVLTPQLRISAASTEEPPAAATVPVAAEEDSPADTATPLALSAGTEGTAVDPDKDENDEARIALGLSALVESEVGRALDALVPSGDEAASSADPDEATAASAPEAEEPVAQDETPAPQSGDSVLERKIAALEHLVSQKDEDWEQDGDAAAASPFFQHNATRAPDWKADLAEPQQRAEPPTDSLATPDPAHAVEDNAMPAQEPPAPDASPASVTNIRRFPHADDSAGPEEPADLLAEVPLTLDEDMLRDLVSDLVRQELQGALGERITRNVRKLVRREIHRVLVSRDFE